MSNVINLAAQVAAMNGWGQQVYGNGEMRVELGLPTGRTQLIQLTPTKDADGDLAVFIWSLAGDMRAAGDPAGLLRWHAQLTYGHVIIHEEQVKVAHVLHDAGATLPEVQKALRCVGNAADQIEQSAYGAGSDTL